MYQIYKHPKGF